MHPRDKWDAARGAVMVHERMPFVYLLTSRCYLLDYMQCVDAPGVRQTISRVVAVDGQAVIRTLR